MEDEGNTGSSTYNITKLNETNYRSWSQQLRWILDERDLWELVNGEEVRPTVSTTQPQQSEQSSTATGDINKLTAWTKKAKKARSIIGSSITASVMTYIEGIDNPVDMWTTLADIYNPKTQTTLLQTVREFMTVKMEDGDMEKHLQRVKRLKRQVEEQGEKVSDTVYNGILLNSVPDDYNIAVNILESQDRLTPEMIINRLMEASRKHGGEDHDGRRVGQRQHERHPQTDDTEDDRQDPDGEQPSPAEAQLTEQLLVGRLCHGYLHLGSFPTWVYCRTGFDHIRSKKRRSTASVE
jgi:hypothetical protein